MNKPIPDNSDPEVTLVCYFHYFAQMWVLGTKIIFKALLGWILICLMLALPAFLFQFIPVIVVENTMTRQVLTTVTFAIYFLVVTPIAFYVGGSTVGFCPWISAADFAKMQNKR